MSERQGLLIVISGPSGVGKTTITRRVIERLNAAYSISMTTRPMAEGDVDGRDYHFVSVDEFKRAIGAGELLEWAEVFSNFYGTPRASVEKMMAEGRDVILEIDVNGAIQVKEAVPHAVTVFILPPSEDTLLQRLRDRGREDESVIQRRFSEAQREITQAKESGAYTDYVVNDNLEAAIAETVDKINLHRTPASL
ncbi:MAG: guanylate kinase [Planctomycetota bacterium]|jgi:guanylate kinase